MKNKIENGILSEQYEKLVIEDIATGKEIAVITDTEVITATETTVVRLTPARYQLCDIYKNMKKEAFKTIIPYLVLLSIWLFGFVLCIVAVLLYY